MDTKYKANEIFQVGWSTLVVGSFLSPRGLERGRKRETQGMILRKPKVKGTGKGRTAKNTGSNQRKHSRKAVIDCQTMEEERNRVTNVLWI